MLKKAKLSVKIFHHKRNMGLFSLYFFTVMLFVDGCPNNFTDQQARSNRLGCGSDKYGNNQYMCLPNVAKTSLVELCYIGIMGIIAKGQ